MTSDSLSAKHDRPSPQQAEQHKRDQADRPRTPDLDGKVERSHRVDEQEFYQLLDNGGITDDIHPFNDKLREWEDYYNYHRPHGALAGR